MIEREILISTLLNEGTVSATACKLKCSPVTVYNRMNEAGFREDFNKAKRDILEATCNRLTSNLLAGVDTVVEIMQDASNSAQIRLNASQQLFNVTLRLNEQIEVLEKLQELEKRFADDEENYIN